MMVQDRVHTIPTSSYLASSSFAKAPKKQRSSSDDCATHTSLVPKFEKFGSSEDVLRGEVRASS
jgi:hypothetical protein